MGGYFPALSIQQPPSVLDQYTRAVQLRSLAGAQQLQQMQIEQQQRQFRSQQAFMNAYIQNQGDISKIVQNPPPDMLPDDVMGAQQHMLTLQTKTSQLTKDQLDNSLKQNDVISREADSMLALPQEQRRAELPNSFARLVRAGAVSPQDAQSQLAQTGQMNDDQLDKFLQVHKYAAISVKDRITQEQKDRETAAQETRAQAEAWKPNPMGTGFVNVLTGETKGATGELGIKATPFESWRQQFKLSHGGREPNTQEIQNFQTAGQAMRIEGLAKMREYPVYDSQTKQTVYLSPEVINAAPPGRYTVPGFTPEAQIAKGTGAAFSPSGTAGKSLTAFNTASLHADLLGQAADALDNKDMRGLNTVSNAISKQFGSPKVTNFETIAKVYEQEILKALGGHVTDAEVKSAGAMIPPNASPAQIKDAIANLKSLMASKIYVLHQQYQQGTQGQPMFTTPPPQAAPTAPAKATHRYNPTTGKIEALP
jgi:hypothetical protein